MGHTMSCSGGKRHQDSLIPEEQHPIIDFNSKFKVLTHVIVINAGLDQQL